LDHTGDLSTRDPRQSDRDRESVFFQPKIQMVQAASFDGDHYFVRAGCGVRHLPELEPARFSVFDELKSSHG